MTKEKLINIAKEYGTPTFVFDMDMLIHRVKNMREILGNEIGLCFSIKANPFLLEDIAPYVDNLEVCSPGELQICMARKIPSEKIIYSGVNKGLEDIDWAISYQSGVYTAESKKQFMDLNQVAMEKNLVIDVLPRLSSGSQFGMSKEDLLWLIDHRQDFSAVHIVGVHYFVGTQRKKQADRDAELAMLLAFFEEAEREHGYVLERLEYGPGLPFPYFESDDFSDTLRPLKETLDSLQRVAKKVKLIVEMGRFIASECGYSLTSVADMKKIEDANYVILDGGMNHLNYLGQMMGMKNPIIEKLTEDGTDNPKDYTLCGSLCTTQDIMVRSKRFSSLTIGDTLAFCNAGAYTVTEGIYLFLSRRMPKIVLFFEDGHTRLMRDAVESFLLNTQALE